MFWRRHCAVPTACRKAHCCSGCTPTGWRGSPTRTQHSSCCTRSITGETSQPPWQWLGTGSLPWPLAYS